MKNIIFDGTYYYLFRSLNSSNVEDLNKGIRDIRTDAIRYREKNGQWGKYNQDSVCSVEEVYDHVRMKHRKDTNCISLTRDANVALTYYTDMMKYVLVKIKPEEIDKYFDAGQYFADVIEEKINEAITKSKTETIEVLDDIERASSGEEIIDILQKYDDTIPIFSINDKQYLTDNNQKRIDKLIAKSKVLENAGSLENIIADVRNSDLISTMGNAFSSAEYISYGNIPQDKVIDCPKIYLDMFSLLQQAKEKNTNNEKVDEITKRVLELIEQGYKLEEKDGRVFYTNGNDTYNLGYESEFLSRENNDKKELSRDIDLHRIYRLTNGQVSYQNAKMQVMAVRALAEMKLKKEELMKIFSTVIDKDELVQVLNGTYCLNPNLLIRQNGRGYKLSETVNFLINDNGQDLDIDKLTQIINIVDNMSHEELLDISKQGLSDDKLTNILQKEDIKGVERRFKDKFGMHNDKKNINFKSAQMRDSKYLVEAIIEDGNWKMFDRTLIKSEKKKLLESILASSRDNEVYQLYNSMIDSGMTQEEVFAGIINISIDKKLDKTTYKDLLQLDSKKQKQIIEKYKDQIRTKVEPIDIDILMQRGKIVKNLKKQAMSLGIVNEVVENINIRNIHFALKIIDEYEFERELTNKEKSVLFQSLVGNKLLSKNYTYNIEKLYNKIKKIGLSEQETYGAIINLAVGNGKGSYTDAIKGGTQYTSREDIGQIEVTEDTIKKGLFKYEINSKENIEQLKEIRVEEEIYKYTKSRNIDFALRIINGYEFEREINQEEKRVLFQSLINNKELNKTGNCYIETLYDKIRGVGLSEQETYGAIINLAVGNGKDAYSEAIERITKYTSREDIGQIEVTEDTINKGLFKYEINSKENIEQLKEIGVEEERYKDIRLQNIDFALKIINGYEFEREINQEEKRVLFQNLTDYKKFSKNSSYYIETLYDKIRGVGLSEQETYGAIINLAVGNGKGSYTDAIRGETKYTSREDIGQIEVTEDTIKKGLFKYEINSKENIEQLKEIGVEEERYKDIRLQNIDFALKIINGYELEREITQEEKRVLFQSLIATKLLSRTDTHYIETLYDKIRGVGLSEQETYGAIINLAVGNGKGNYTDAINGTTKYTSREDIGQIEVTEDTIKKGLFKYEINSKENIEQLKEIGIDEEIYKDIKPQNIDFALKIINSYEFERKITQEEKKVLMQSLLESKMLSKINNLYIETLYDKIRGVGLSEQDAYGAIINLAVGKGKRGYSKNLNGETKYTSREDIVQVEVTEDTINKAKIKVQKSAEKLAKSTVCKGSIEKIDDTLDELERMQTRERDVNSKENTKKSLDE